MKISTLTTRQEVSGLLRETARGEGQPKSTERHLQDVFSAVLEGVGRDGYVSAKPLQEDSSLADEVGSSWDSWFTEFSPIRYSFHAGSHSPSVRKGKTAEDLRVDYKAILDDAYHRGGFATPKSYLQTLSADQLATIQQVQHLAEPIRVSNLADEAALNLLLPPSAQVDANRDGLVSVGAAQTLRFPDSQTPTIVRDAWESSIADVPTTDRLTYELMMTRSLSPSSEAGAIDPGASVPENFVRKANDWLEYLESFKSFIPVDRYQQDKTFWTSFRNQILNPVPAE